LNKATVRLDKVNQVLALFGYHLEAFEHSRLSPDLQEKVRQVIDERHRRLFSC
jgi:hypothetical protein